MIKCDQTQNTKGEPNINMGSSRSAVPTRMYHSCYGLCRNHNNKWVKRLSQWKSIPSHT